MNEELTLAIGELRQRSYSQAWFIPVRLDDCTIPDRPIGPGESLHDIQRVDLFPDWDEGVRRILSVVRPQEGPIQIDRRDLEILLHGTTSTLYSLGGIIDRLGREDLPPARRQQLASDAKALIETAAIQGKNIVALGLSLQDRPLIFPTEVDLTSELQMAAKRLGAISRERRLLFQFTGLESLPRRMLLDRSLIRQLLQEVLSNAVKYSLSTGGQDNSIQIKASKPDRDLVRLEVSNRSLPLSAHELQRVFERGYRGTGAAGVAVGTGLGLFMARKIASVHAGSIGIKSQPGDLVVVTIDLPIREK